MQRLTALIFGVALLGLLLFAPSHTARGADPCLNPTRDPDDCVTVATKTPTPTGNFAQWLVARDLCQYESWQMKYTAHLPRLKDLWTAHFAS